MKKQKKIINLVKKEVEPSKEELREVSRVSKEIIKKINKRARKYKAEIKVGGSVAKGTWLPGIHDIDCFLLFNYSKYKDKSDSLSKYGERIIKKCFKEYKRLNGSRDYFQVNYSGFDIEIIPALKIKKPEMMKNITDVSPLHFNWLSKKTRKKKLETEVRVAKKFFRANECYGAESFIKGFSGHVIEILIAHYGGFLKLIKKIANWKGREIIDPEGKYKNKKRVILMMNKSKLRSPLVVVDPIQPERNAAAVVSREKFKLIRKSARKFLKKPSRAQFEKKKVTLKKIKGWAKMSKSKLILLSVTPDKKSTIDVAGCKILKEFEYIKRLLKDFDFKIKKSRWNWDKKKDALLWFYVDPKKLSKKFRHWGPPEELKEHADAFKKQWKKYGVKKKKGKLYVDLPRKVRTVEDFLKELKKDEKVSAKIIC